MKIAFISYEYPPDTAVGGIGTYVYQVSQVMKKLGHHVEVFCASHDRTISEDFESVYVHRVLCSDAERFKFKDKILDVFSRRHESIGFDLFESPEYSADGLSIKHRFPELTLVVKLHTPHYLIRQLSCYYDGILAKSRYVIGGLRRGKLPRPYWKYLKTKEDPDYLITRIADQIHTPSVSLGDIVANKWKIDRKVILNVPYPYIPKPTLLLISPDNLTNTVTFVGRLEVRKGVVNLCDVIPLVLKKHPEIKFRFCGNSSESPVRGIDMKSYLRKQLKPYGDSIQFLQVRLQDIHTIYESTDICVFPSIWENFPNVCLEAMSAARGIVASKEGGMKDMLDASKAGLLIDPLDPNEIAGAIIYLLENISERQTMGRVARARLLSAYNQDEIGKLMEKYYRAALTNRPKSIQSLDHSDLTPNP